MLGDAKARAVVAKELGEGYIELLQAIKGTTREARTVKKLWRDGSKSKLIKLGLAFIVFPEPTPISETIGVCLVAAGAVQKGIKHGTLYADDVYKLFQSTLRDIRNVRYSF